MDSDQKREEEWNVKVKEVKEVKEEKDEDEEDEGDEEDEEEKKKEKEKRLGEVRGTMEANKNLTRRAPLCKGNFSKILW